MTTRVAPVSRLHDSLGRFCPLVFRGKTFVIFGSIAVLVALAFMWRLGWHILLGFDISVRESGMAALPFTGLLGELEDGYFMNVHVAMQTRRTCHTWQDQTVPEEVVERALEAAHMAPCHRLTWPWRFVRVGPQGRERLFEIALALKVGDGEVSDALRQKVGRKVKNPAHLIAVTQRPAATPEVHREDYAAISCAIQNMALSVHADGYASKWGTGGLTRAEDTYQLLGLNRHEEEIVAFIWIGVPDNPPQKPPARPPLADHVRKTL